MSQELINIHISMAVASLNCIPNNKWKKADKKKRQLVAIKLARESLIVAERFINSQPDYELKNKEREIKL